MAMGDTMIQSIASAKNHKYVRTNATHDTNVSFNEWPRLSNNRPHITAANIPTNVGIARNAEAVSALYYSPNNHSRSL